MGAIASQMTSLTIVYSTVYSDADERNHQSSASLAFVRGIQGPVNSPHKWPATRKMFPFDDVIMLYCWRSVQWNSRKQCLSPYPDICRSGWYMYLARIEMDDASIGTIPAKNGLKPISQMVWVYETYTGVSPSREKWWKIFHARRAE